MRVTITGRRLGAKLTTARDAARLSQKDAARELGCAWTTLIRAEKGNPPKLSLLRSMADLYSASEGEAALWESLRVRSTQLGWWVQEPYSAGELPDYELLCSIEEQATHIIRVSPALIPSLLQTPSYAGVMEHGPLTTAAAGYINLKQGRWKAICERETPPNFTAFIDESAFLRPYGGPKVMAKQLEHLLALPDWVELCILPLDRATALGVGSGFTVFEVDAEHTVSVDGAFGSVYYERLDQIQRAIDVVAILRDEALSAAESQKFIQQHLERLHHA